MKRKILEIIGKISFHIIFVVVVIIGWPMLFFLEVFGEMPTSDEEALGKLVIGSIFFIGNALWVVTLIYIMLLQFIPS